ncbi:hypothetical protein AB6D83_10455 [Vibrio cyclitrophicus]
MQYKKLPDIRTLWIGGDLSRLEYICLNSFVKQGHNVYLYTYDTVGNVPPEVTILDAEEILKRENIFTYGSVTGEGKGSYAGFANYFRYMMLLKNVNSFWVDADIIALRPFTLNQDIQVGKESEEYINNAVIGIKNSNNYILKELVEYCQNPFKIKRWDNYKFIIRKIIGRTIGKSSMNYLPWGVTGPKALTGFCAKHSVNGENVEKYYPISSDSWKDIFFTDNNTLDSEELLLSSHGLHLWNEKLRREGIDKNTIFSDDSLYETLIKKLDLEA